MSQPTVISAHALSKAYRVWETPAARLTSPLQSALAGLVPAESRARRWLSGQAARHYRDFYALQDVSFTVAKGECVGIIGRNGSGKSTLLQLITGTLQPTSGQVSVNGRVAALLELGAGFNAEFTGRENVYLSGAVLGLGQKEMEARFDEVAAFADIGDFLDQPVKTYSSGMLMRLAFAVNTCVDPDILIVDEALSVGDAPFQAKCFRRLRQLLERGVSLLFVSHDLGTVRSICTRALWLKNGRAEKWGAAKEVARDYEKFCWQEQGIVLEEAGTPDPAPEQPRQAAVQETALAGDQARGDFTVALEPGEPPAHLFSASLPHPAGADVSRYGTQAVRIENLVCTNSRGEPAATFGFNEVITLHYLLVAEKPVSSDIVIGIRLKDPRENYLFSVQDFTKQHRLEAPAGARFYARTSFRLPLTHDKYFIKTGIFGFAEGDSRPGNRYDFSRAILWDILENAGMIEVTPYPVMPLVGPVQAQADLLVKPLPDAQASVAS